MGKCQQHIQVPGNLKLSKIIISHSLMALPLQRSLIAMRIMIIYMKQKSKPA